ncbi:MAG: hypothetical protein ACYTFW_10600, partial [Planctomycetota bacterium]
EAQIGSSLKTQRICRRFSPKEHLCRLRDTKTLSYFNERIQKRQRERIYELKASYPYYQLIWEVIHKQ